MPASTFIFVDDITSTLEDRDADLLVEIAGRKASDIEFALGALGSALTVSISFKFIASPQFTAAN